MNWAGTCPGRRSMGTVRETLRKIVQEMQTCEMPYRVRCWQDERRANPRLRCKGIAEIIVLPLLKKLSGTLLDLSVKGCCIDTTGPLPPVEHPSVEVLLTVNGFTLRLAGVVRNVRRERRAGIEFMDVTERKAEQIQELVAELLERNAPERGRSTSEVPSGALV